MLDPKIKKLSDVASAKLKIFEFLDMTEAYGADELELAKLEMINANYKLIEAIRGEYEKVSGVDI